MIGIMLLSENERESQILKMAFEQFHVKTIITSPSYANYVKTLQYLPDIVIMEIPRLSHNHLHFASLIRKNKKTRKTPIIGYGSKVEAGIKRDISRNGITNYLDRPLKFSPLLTLVEKYLKAVNKSIKTNEKKDSSEKEEDVKQILNPRTLPVKKVELMVKYISNLMAFPFTVVRVLHLADNEKSGATDLAKVVEADPVIAASVLKVSNTVFFASRNRRVNTIKDAIIRIGFKETKRIVMTMSVMDILGKEDNNFGFNRKDFWLHSLATAIISSQLSRQLEHIQADEAFLAGLLHDFGIILLDEFFPTIFSQILEATTNKHSRFIDNEDDILQITHNEVVRELFSTWKIPDSINEAVVNHYTVASSEKKIETKGELLALCVFMGNMIAKALNHGKGCDQFVVPIKNDFLKLVKRSLGIDDTFIKKTNHELELYQKFLNIESDSKHPEPNGKKIGVYKSQSCLFTPVKMYLESLGYSVTLIMDGDSFAEYDNQLDAICWWADSESTVEKLHQLANIIQYCENEADPSQEPPMAPVLILKDKETLDSADKVVTNAVFINNELDLRYLDVNLIKLLNKEEKEQPQTAA